MSFSQQAIQYSVETRARAIIFNIGTFEVDRTLHRRPSSLTPPRSSSSDQLQRSFRKEHKGLMSWPESIYKAKKQQEINRTALSLSERAMQLSIFGSMVRKRSQLDILLRLLSMTFSTNPRLFIFGYSQLGQSVQKECKFRWD